MTVAQIQKPKGENPAESAVGKIQLLRHTIKFMYYSSIFTIGAADMRRVTLLRSGGPSRTGDTQRVGAGETSRCL